MMTFSRAEGTRVLSRSSAEVVGAVHRFVVDVPGRRIRALHVGGRKRKAVLVDWSALSGFGPDAVVVAQDEALRGAADEWEERVVSGDLELHKRLVLTDRGEALGRISDIAFDETTGKLTELRLDAGEPIAAPRLRSIGPYCVVVAAA